eukprot:CAMPEP_0168827680 /NCGR_PEP_ID=MMETSP0727-20121128/122_1 /TAXON_ID=265536 /ORGANISM="Amphiprora sp., Strain CCMP467" /LENGTH=1091 /DNA_ID=CAMNT_0008880851 /DNA_START=70 /DNA_END=3342 /DNA_ORIENTATION=-
MDLRLERTVDCSSQKEGESSFVNAAPPSLKSLLSAPQKDYQKRYRRPESHIHGGNRSDSNNDSDCLHKPQAQQAPHNAASPVATQPKMLDASEVDRYLTRAAIFALGSWLILVAIIFTLVPDEQWEHLQGVEKEAPLIATIVLVAVLTYAYSSIFLGNWQNGGPHPSGILIASFVTVMITIFTNLHLAFSSTPVLIDPFTGLRVFVMRWVEWIPLAGLMTFMTEAVDMERGKKGIWPAVWSAVNPVVSSTCGLIFPFCQNTVSWMAVLVFAVSSYSKIIPRVYEKRARLLNESKGVTVLEQENFSRRYYAYRLLSSCSLIWTCLVIMFGVNSGLHKFLPPGHRFRNESFALCADTAFDVVAKGLYLGVIVELHKMVFDSYAREQRQFHELRNLMKVLWDSTTDVILVSVRGKDKTSSVFSPSFQTLLGMDPSKTDCSVTKPGVLLHTKCSIDGEQRVIDARFIDSHHISPTENMPERISPIGYGTLQVKVARELIQSCWNHMDELPSRGCDDVTKNALLVVHEFDKENGERCSCELKLSRRPDSFVAIVRDVTERTKRFEAEQRATAEALARQKDAQGVNRFTRHEIKNGLLAGIELCERLNRSFQSASNRVDQRVSATMDKDEYKTIESDMTKTAGMIGQVDHVLHEVLETVLAEAMARDVIYEIYQPLPKKVDIVEVLKSSGRGTGTEHRFPLVLPSKNIPKLILDTQLLLYIHRNAISNAVKYGRAGGMVSTTVRYNEHSELLKIDVSNEPGPGHEKLLNQGKVACAAVFLQSTRLHENIDSISGGDGAWIMQKCAKNMGGSCAISFQKVETVFSFQCHAKAVSEDETRKLHFELPLNTYAIAIDDSWIQRKLMLRIFSDAGIPQSQKKALGRNPSELDSVGGLIDAILDQHDFDGKILVLVDENLDYSNGEESGFMMRSGSKLMEGILAKLQHEKRDRLLVLVRSANDSADDIETYTSRTHGFFPKTSTKRADVLEVLEAAWVGRFGKSHPTSILDRFICEDPSDDSSIAPEDLQEAVASVDSLLQGRSFREVEWEHLWSSLHALKGDIMISNDTELCLAAKEINSLRGPTPPDTFDESWTSIRRHV